MPSAAPSGESVSVESNSAIAATPSIDSDDVAERQQRALDELRRGEAWCRRRSRCRSPASPSPSRSGPTTYADDRDDEHREQHERHDADQLGDQQPGAADRPDQHVAQRAACASPAIASPRDDRDRDRQEQRQHDRQRGEREQRAVGEHRGQERRARRRAAGRGR